MGNKKSSADQPDDQPRFSNADAEDLGSAARALTDAAAALTRVLGESFHEVKPRLSQALTTGLREAADSLDGASAEVKTRARSFETSRRAQRSAETREGLLVAAARVITEKGYSAASVEDIAAAAGYTKGAVYTHFATKLDLFAALAIVQLQASQPLPKKGKLAKDIAKSLRQQSDPSCVLLTLEMLALAVRDAEFREMIGSAWIDALEIVAAQVAANRGADPASPPTAADRDTAIGLVSAINLARALVFVALPGDGAAGDSDPIDVTIRLVNRLLET
ncbi:MAG: TetR/AcrR family transcriptional regulator [Micrococcales bacterium]|nr:TetR/AcrR family transcriptional regulator [Micrococcales bacterium]